jgi:hypothetical protein
VQLERDVIEQARKGSLAPKTGPSRLFAACDAYLTAKRIIANRERTVEFDEERLAIVKDRLGDVLLSTITRETIEGFQSKRKLDGVSNRTVNMDVGALRKVLKRYGHWRRLQDDVSMLSETEGPPVGRALMPEEQELYRVSSRAAFLPRLQRIEQDFHVSRKVPLLQLRHTGTTTATGSPMTCTRSIAAFSSTTRATARCGCSTRLSIPTRSPSASSIRNCSSTCGTHCWISKASAAEACVERMMARGGLLENSSC